MSESTPPGVTVRDAEEVAEEVAAAAEFDIPGTPEFDAGLAAVDAGAAAVDSGRAVVESGVAAVEPGLLAADEPEAAAEDEDETAGPAGEPAGDVASGAESGAESPAAAVRGDGVVPGEDAAPGAGGSRPTASGESRHDLLVAEGDAAGDYLERLLDILDYDGDIDLDVEGERAVVSIIGSGDVERLIGDHGEVLEALQELSRLAATTETGQRSRLMLDIAGFRARRREELAALGRETAEAVLRTGEPVKLSPMNPFERKVVHDAVGTVDGVTSSSEGEEPHRRIVVALAS